jgi:hypothetical protein
MGRHPSQHRADRDRPRVDRVGSAGVNEVRDKLAQENIVGTDDSSIPGQNVDTGSEAKAFADVTRKHALDSAACCGGAMLHRPLRRRRSRPPVERRVRSRPEGGPWAALRRS